MSTPSKSSPMPSDQPLMTRQFVLLLTMTSCFGFAWSFYLILPKFFTAELGLDPGTIGRLVAVQGVAAVLAAPIVGRLVDRFGRRRWCVAGNIGLWVTGIGYCFVHHHGPLLYVMQVVWGLALVLTFNSAGTLAADLAPPSRLAQAIGLFGAANLGMNAVSPLLGEFLAQDFGWRSVFLVSACSGLLAAFLARFLEEAPQPAGPDLPHNGSHPVLGWPLIQVYGAMFAITAAFTALFVLHQPFAIEHGVDRVGTFFLGFAVVALSVRIFGGRLIDRIGAYRSAVWSMCVYSLVPPALAILGPRYLLFIGAFMGLGHGVAYPATTALGVERTNATSRGLVIAIVHGSFNGGHAVFAYSLGALAHHVGFVETFWLAGGVTLLGALWLSLGHAWVRMRAPAQHGPQG